MCCYRHQPVTGPDLKHQLSAAWAPGVLLGLKQIALCRC